MFFSRVSFNFLWNLLPSCAESLPEPLTQYFNIQIFKSSLKIFLFNKFYCNVLKVTVQFETEGNSQNEIVSHMDRSEVKL